MILMILYYTYGGTRTGFRVVRGPRAHIRLTNLLKRYLFCGGPGARAPYLNPALGPNQPLKEGPSELVRPRKMDKTLTL